MLLSLVVIPVKIMLSKGAYFYYFGLIGRKVKHAKIMINRTQTELDSGLFQRQCFSFLWM